MNLECGLFIEHWLEVEPVRSIQADGTNRALVSQSQASTGQQLERIDLINCIPDHPPVVENRNAIAIESVYPALKGTEQLGGTSDWLNISGVL